MMKHDATTEVEKLLAQRKRWQSKLRRAVNAIGKIDAKLKRLERKPKPVGKPDKVDKPATDVPLLSALLPRVGDVKLPDDPLDIRNQPWARNPADEQAKAEILAGQEAKQKARQKASAERRKAKAKGELRRMPLTGKAALAAIRGE